MTPTKNEHRKKTRRIDHRPIIEKKYYIFCEGKETEPLYFEGLKKAIERNPIYRNMILVEIEGVGAETLKVLEKAEQKVHDQRLINAQIWCVYDKDSFPPDRFNRVSERVKTLNRTQSDVEYCTGWSNQCIEYWFILHFDFYDSNNDRKYYRNFLNKKFKKLGWHKYQKNNDRLFEILSRHGNPQQAISWAKQRLDCCSG